ncbi:hypothetical protein FKV24_012615 [Lysobacter maris]|uniref:Uncharacterized protein n=1 Tax=Marilutibacter maris TaxID=1605891 RepID=A0A508AK35_9GAMM|nr:hypothetical protein [Lysobacter maris]KAB8180172.1 hypothetical protein FKV24_012615 [Lysobacter maris]
MIGLAPTRIPAASDLLDTLPDMADGLQSQLIELHKRPSLDRCDHLLANLAGAIHTLQKLQAAMRREGSGDDQ